ncbi:MAG: LamG domain-containing protein [Rhizobiales bacterium]|nr:LamG domain-containing protein [Hyphomicrobiales bacterium]
MRDFLAFRDLRLSRLGAMAGGGAGPAPLTLRQQVEALANPGGVGPAATPTPINPASLPSGMTTSGTRINITSSGTYSGHDFAGYRLVIDAADVVLEDCRVYDPGTFGSAAYVLEVTETATNFQPIRCEFEGSGLPRRTDDLTASGPGTTVLIASDDLDMSLCRIWNFAVDGFKITGDNPKIHGNVIGSALAVPDWEEYSLSNTYAAFYPVMFNGRPYVSKQAVPINTPPSGTTSDTPYWAAPAPHTDYITVVAGAGAKIYNNYFVANSGTFYGATQYIRAIRNTGSSPYLGEVQVFANVFQPWPGSYPLAAGYTRDVADQNNYDIGDVVIEDDRFFECISPTVGSAEYPSLAPAKWQETLDPRAGNVIFAHNWVAAGSGGATFYPFDAHNGQIVWGSNYKEADNTAAPARDGMTVLDTLSEPSFGSLLAYTEPTIQYTGSDILITPTSYGKYRVSGVDIDACVVRVGPRVFCYITPGGTAYVPAGVPAIVEAAGPSKILRLRDLAGDPISGPVSIAAGTATVVEAVAPASVLSVGFMGQSEVVYLFQVGGAYSSLTPKPTIPTDGNVILHTQESVGSAPVRTVVTQAAVNAETVNPAMGAIAAFLDYAQPGVIFHIGDLAVAGTGRPSLYDDTTDGSDGRLWSDFTAVVDEIETETGEPLGHLIECWYNADAGSIGNFVNAFWPFYFGTDGAGSSFTLGGTNVGTQVDHCLWDGTAATDAKGRGIFTRDDTQWHVLTPMPFHNAPSSPDPELLNFSENDARLSEPDRQVMHDLAANTLAQSVNITVGPSAHVCKFGGNSTQIHPDTGSADGQILFAWPFALAMLRASGMTIGEPVISAIEGASDGSYADLVVDLPNGGTLTTLRTFRSGPSYAGSAPHRQAVTGVEITRSGGERRPVFNTSETSYPVDHRGTVTITDTGSGSPRKGRVRITPTTPFAFGDKLSYLRGQATAVLFEPRDFELYPDFLIEHVPGLYDSSATYPFEGIAVRPYQADLSAPVDPPSFTPRGATHNGSTAYRSTSMTGIPATSQGMVSMWYRSTDTAWNASARTLFSFRVGSNIRLEAKTSTSGRVTVSIYNDTGSNNMVCYAGPSNLQHVTGQWYHMLVEWTGTAANVWINGNLVGTKAYASILMAGNNLTQMGIGAQSTGSQYWLGDLAHVWISVSERLDLSVLANREKFALAGVPVNLGPNGQTPTGTAPEWYYDGDAPAWSNQGTAGSIALDGGPLTASGAPSY